MDFLPSIDELQDHLMAHDRAVRQIIVLDGYIERMSEQTFIAAMGDQMTPAFQKMIRVGVAEGVKRMFKEYRLMKWLKVQEMAAMVRQILSQEFIGQMNEHHGQANTQEEHEQHPQAMIPLQMDRYQANQLQAENQPWQMSVPEAYNWVPVTDNWVATTPQDETSLLQIVSPIMTPLSAASTPISNSTVVADHPEQLAFQGSPFGRPSQTNRQLFPDQTSDIQVTSDICDPEDYPRVDSASVNGVYTTVGASLESSEQVRAQSAVSEVTGFRDIRMAQVQEQEPAIMDWEHMYEDDDEDEDEFDSDYDDEDDQLAGVLYAAERLLPDEQTARLDVEMGDMGVGHILFDRVSATWYTAQCEFYRGD